MRISRTGIWTSTSLEPALIRLSAADEMQEFWEATKALLHLALPIHFCCLCFRPFIVMPATVFREHTPFASDAEFRRFRELCPFSAYVERHPGIRVIRLTDIIDNSKLLKTEFFRLFMQPCADRYQAYLVLWESSLFQGLVGLHRTAQQRDFTDTEIHLLEQLYPHFENAGRRVLSSHREKARRMSLEILLSRLPIATIILDWDLRVTYRNRAAEELGVLWNLGPQAARSLKLCQHFELPSEILETCRNLKNTWDHGESDDAPPRVDNRLVIEHQHLAGLRASVNVLQMDAAPLSRPMFLVTLERRDSSPSDSGEHLNQLATWAQLTRSEQQVAWLAGQGQRNAEIAQSLKKSTMTVKKQLQSIYHKLDVTVRGRLIALLRPTDYFDSGKQQLIGRGLAENGRFKEAGWFG
jgi:DNA-binding CsgD family transcriptional regulator/PAS domain-containing protein